MAGPQCRPSSPWQRAAAAPRAADVPATYRKDNIGTRHTHTRTHAWNMCVLVKVKQNTYKAAGGERSEAQQEAKVVGEGRARRKEREMRKEGEGCGGMWRDVEEGKNGGGRGRMRGTRRKGQEHVEGDSL